MIEATEDRVTEPEQARRANLFVAFARNWVGAFGDGLRAVKALPLVVLAMAAIELAQHVVEFRIGFFSGDLATRRAVVLDPLRMAFGWPKMFATWAVAFFAIRYLVLGDARAALRPPIAALKRYAWVVLFLLIPFAVILYAEPIVALLGLDARAVTSVRVIAGLGQQLLEPGLCLWFLSAALGSDAFEPFRSAGATRWLWFWGFALIFLARIPFNAAHQLLNRYAAGQQPVVLWPMLVLDALVVIVLVTVVAAAEVRVARFVTERRGLALPGTV